MAYKLGTLVYDATSLKKMRVKEVRYCTPLSPSDGPEIWYVLEDLEKPDITYTRQEKAVVEDEKAIINKITEDLCKTIAEALKVKNQLVSYLAWLQDCDMVKHAEIVQGKPQEEDAPPTTRKRKTRHIWTDDEKLFVMDLLDKNVKYSAIAEALKARFGFSVSAVAVQTLYHKHLK